MGRKKKIKSLHEKEEYRIRRREQNRINQSKFRKRKKIVNVLQNYSFDNSRIKKEYIDELSHCLKEFDFDFYITLTMRENSSIKKLIHLIPRFIEQVKTELKLGFGFYIVESGLSDRPHIHLLVKSQTSLKKMKEVINRTWMNGFVDIQRVYSDFDNYTLEKYVLKEVSILSSDELIWDFFNM
jgi:hypothetical protein